jgi:hypothetical protein
MSDQITAPRITAADRRTSRRARAQWQLAVLWQCENEAESPVYLVVNQPITTAIGDPLILDHSAVEPLLPLSANQRTDFEIITIMPRSKDQRWWKYSLALSDAPAERTVIGRFGYSRTPPDDAWVKTQNLRNVAAWQQLVDSDPFTVRFA